MLYSISRNRLIVAVFCRVRSNHVGRAVINVPGVELPLTYLDVYCPCYSPLNFAAVVESKLDLQDTVESCSKSATISKEDSHTLNETTFMQNTAPWYSLE
jgi:hypothetical protein